jgi:hypothetical protein
MKSIFIIENVSPLAQVASQKSATGTTGVRTILMRELGGQWAPSYAAKVFSPQAEEQFRTGGVVAASLRLRATTNQMSGQTYQDVVAEEIVTLSTPSDNDIL